MAVKRTSTSPIVGRKWLISELQDWLKNGGRRATLVGPPGIGKSCVAQALCQASPDSVYVDFQTSKDPFESIEEQVQGGKPKKLLVLDGIEAAPASVWEHQSLDRAFPDIPKLYIFRPGVHYEGLQQPGTRLFALDPYSPHHEQDLNDHLTEHGVETMIGLISTFQEAQFLIENPEQGANQLESYYLALWRAVTRAHKGSTRVLMEQIALLLADTPEGLPFEAISDFTGIPLVSVRESVDFLAPILTIVPSGVTLFSPGLAHFLTKHFSRDLGPVHGRVVSFFRETYPSWHEMHDPYGWRYLVLHCDRLARASRRQDFSVLHWLNEGSFSHLKLERTGMLPSVLKDLRLSLLASLETEDLPRIISFGCRVARLRKHDSVKTVHRLADAGSLPLARENAFLVSGEENKFLTWLLFATQTLEGRDLSSTTALLSESLYFLGGDPKESEIRLGAHIMGTMLSYPGLPEKTAEILQQALAMGGQPEAAALSLKTAAHNHLLTDKQRTALLESALKYVSDISEEDQREAYGREIAARLARLSGRTSEPGVAYPARLEQAKNRDKEFQSILEEVRKGTTLIATAAASIVPITDEPWSRGAFEKLIKLVDVNKDIESLKHGLSGLLQSLEDSVVKELDHGILDGLSVAILALEKPEDRSRYLARFAVLLTVKGRPLEAQQRISLSAANAFSVADTADRSDALFHLAGLVATTGALGRARDLAFHALELASRVDDLDRECRQLVRLLSTSTAKNNSAEEILRLGDSLRFDNSPMELEAKGRALVALAAGLTRLGADEQAKAYRERAIETTRSISNLELKIHLLCDLSAALYQSGEKRQARRLSKEARGLYEENQPERELLSATALLRISMILENRSQTKKFVDYCLSYLKANDLKVWLSSPALLDLLGLCRHLGRTEELHLHLNDARQADDLTDDQMLGLLRCELELGEFQRAEALLDRLGSIAGRCRGGIDLSLAFLPIDAERSLYHLANIPLESRRCEGIRRLALLNGSEIRPTEQARVRHVLNNLTLMAIDHPDAMDSVLSRWIQSCPDRDTILAIADKMEWSVGAGTLFREAHQSHSESHEALEGIEPAEPEASTPVEEPALTEIPVIESAVTPHDDGFKVVSLTKPKE